MENGPDAAMTATDLVKDTDAQNFAADVLEASMAQPVVVDFWAPWCGPCRTLGPMLEAAVTEAGGAVRMVKVNIDENQLLAQQLTQAGLPLQSIPAVFAFKDGQPVDGFVGAIPESQIKEFITRLGGDAPAEGPNLEEAVAAAGEAVKAGDLDAAAQIYGAVLQEEPNHPGALAGLAQIYIGAGDLEHAEQALGLVAPEHENDPAVKAAKAALQLAGQTAESGEVAELRAKVDANPKDHQARFDLALALNGEGNREEALEELLTIVRMDRKWNDDGARKQLVTLFEAWGPTDELTIKGRQDLSGILFS